MSTYNPYYTGVPGGDEGSQYRASRMTPTATNYTPAPTPARETTQPNSWTSANAWTQPAQAQPAQNPWAAQPQQQQSQRSGYLGWDASKFGRAGASPKYTFGDWMTRNVSDPRQWAQSWAQFAQTDPRWQGWTPMGDRLVYTGQGGPDSYFGDLRDIDVVKNYTGTGQAKFAWLKKNGRGAKQQPVQAAPPPQQAMPMIPMSYQAQPSQDSAQLAQMLGQLQAQFQAYQQQQEAARREAEKAKYLADRAATVPRFSYY